MIRRLTRSAVQLVITFVLVFGLTAILILLGIWRSDLDRPGMVVTPLSTSAEVSR